MNQPTSTTAVPVTPPFDPLDMKNYGLEKLREIAAGPIMAKAKFIGVPLAILAFLFFTSSGAVRSSSTTRPSCPRALNCLTSTARRASSCFR